MGLANIKNGLVELVFPTRCAGCDRPGALLCERCRTSLVLADPMRSCPRCGAPEGVKGCAECTGISFAFDRARCVGPLTEPLSRLVTVYKDGHERRLARLLGGLLVQAVGGWADWADVVVCVPAAPAAVARRGFDHAALLAQAIGRSCGLSSPRLLRFERARDQRGLGREKRRANAAGAFTISEPVVVPSHVILVDDVLTTGATLDSAARTLKTAGAVEVRGLVVARAMEA